MNDVLADILKAALEDYEGCEDGLYFPALDDQVVTLDDEKIAYLLESLGYLADAEKASFEDVDDLYNRYYEDVDRLVLSEAIVSGEIKVNPADFR